MRAKQTTPCGFTLIELVVSMAATAILLAGLFVALGVSAKALSPSMAGNAVVAASNSLSDLTADLQLAIDFTERSATAVTFTVADRNGDAVAESIRYAWSGTGGDPLTRQYNGGAVHVVLDAVTDFQLQYDVKTVVDNGTTKYNLRSVRVTLQPTDNAATRLYSTALVLNAPEVAAP